MSGREFSIELPHLRLSALEWGPGDGRPVLALHGWLDNAASFQRMAPMLDGFHVVALDLAGHGRSQHRPPGVVHHFVDWPPEIGAVADALEWPSFSLIGHSMGAGISSLVPAAFPGRVRRTVLLEGVGPLAAEAERAPSQLVSALADEKKSHRSTRRVFPNLEAAIRARVRDTDLDTESARLLVERGSETGTDGVAFLHDARLKTRSRLRFTEDQVLAFLGAIDCPVLAVQALQGWPFPEDIVRNRLAAIPDLEQIEVEGGHHVHLTHPDRIAPAVRDFLAG